jgi:hypothetical protein
MPDTSFPDLKTAAHELIDALPSNATWDDVMYRIYVRQAVEAGLKDLEEDRGIEVDEVRRRFGLPPA